MSLLSCFRPPLLSLIKVFFHTFTSCIAKTKNVLRLHISLTCGFFIPFCRLNVILNHTFTQCITNTKIVLCLGISLFC